MSFFDGPILNSPYYHPGRHWELDDEGQPSDRILSRRRPSALWTALPGRSAKSAKTQKSLVFDDSDLSTEAIEFNPSPIVNDLRQELDIWRALPNPSQLKVSPITQRLLQHWRALQADESQPIRPFFCQLEAVEAAIWLTEVAPQMGKRGKRFLEWMKVANNFAVQPDGAPASAAQPELMRIAFKLATGAGKTTVMAMLIVWQTLNAVRSSNSKRFSKGFLIVTPGITIRDRLRVLHLLLATRGPDPDREMAAPLQHCQTAQRSGIPSAGTRKHRPDRPETDHALTIKPDHSMGADQPVMYGSWEYITTGARANAVFGAGEQALLAGCALAS